jgi:hypothetical protein
MPETARRLRAEAEQEDAGAKARKGNRIHTTALDGVAQPPVSVRERPLLRGGGSTPKGASLTCARWPRRGHAESCGLKKLLNSGGSSQANPERSALRFDAELHSKKGTTAALEKNPFEGMTGHFGLGREPERITVLEFDQFSRERADPCSEPGPAHALLRRKSAKIACDCGMGQLCHDEPPSESAAATVELGRQAALCKDTLRKQLRSCDRRTSWGSIIVAFSRVMTVVLHGERGLEAAHPEAGRHRREMARP